MHFALYIICLTRMRRCFRAVHGAFIWRPMFSINLSMTVDIIESKRHHELSEHGASAGPLKRLRLASHKWPVSKAYILYHGFYSKYVYIACIRVCFVHVSLCVYICVYVCLSACIVCACIFFLIFL